MKHKARVLARYPNATLQIVRRWADGSPRYCAVYVQDLCLDIHEPETAGGLNLQSATAAWRSAHFWCVRHPAEEAVG